MLAPERLVLTKTVYHEHLINYLVQFHAVRDYFECHEILEEYWKEHPDDPHSYIYVGLIQVAVAQYHERRGNTSGAEKMYHSAVKRLKHAPLEQLGINSEDLLEQLEERLQAITFGLGFEDIDMWIVNQELSDICMKHAQSIGCQWGDPSSLQNRALVHRHMLRDRSDVIAARQQALLQKRSLRN